MPVPDSIRAPADPLPVAPGSLGAWVIALRPRSLLIAVSPVIVGSALVYQRTGSLDVPVLLLILAASVMLQVITNLENDVGATLRAGERARAPVGMPRATALGLLTPRAVHAAIVASVAMTVVLGLPLVVLRGAPVLAMGVASIVAAYAYMGGPYPIAYTPLGELVVFVFFGLIAVAGTDFVLTGSSVPASTLLAAAAIGLLATAALVVNNHRDVEHDAAIGRRTLAVVLGAHGSIALYAACVLVPYALLGAIAWLAGSLFFLLPLLGVPAAVALARAFRRTPPGLAQNRVLFGTFKLELGYAALLAAGAVAARVAST